MMFAPYGYGFGAAALVQGTDFKCVDKAGKALPICFAVGQANHALLQQLQQTMNRFSGSAGFVPLVVDGFIGPASVAALGKIGLVGAPTTKEQITATAPTLIDQLTSMASQRANAAQPLSPPGAPVLPTPAAAVAIATGQPPPAAASAASAVPKSSLGWWIAGGVAAVLVVGVGGFVYYRRKAPQARAAR